MIDHLLGRPSTRLRKYQVFTVVLLWSLYVARSDQHGPAPVRAVSRYLSKRLTIWRTTVLFFLSLYVSRNFARVVGLESPEPLANLYTRSYFRATWVTTALDAGYWTAMHLRPDALRQVASLIFSIYFLVCAEQADELVRRVRGGLTLQHLRVSWDKPETGLLAFFTRLLRHKTGMMKRQPRRIFIPRPKASSYSDPVEAWLYYDQPDDELADVTKIIFDVPGGGFVAMSPRCHEDKLLAWAGRTKLPVVALNYRKAPEYPYPYALNECYDAYHSIMRSKGKCIGLSGETMPKVVVTGDSAGGNLATAMILMLLQESPYAPYIAGSRGHSTIPLPEALVSIYPALDMSIKSWMTDEQMSLIRRPERRKTNQGVLRRKSEDYRTLTPTTPQGSDDEDEDLTKSRRTIASSRNLSQFYASGSVSSSATVTPYSHQKAAMAANANQHSRSMADHDSTPTRMRTRLAMSSIISYFNDRVLSPEMLRAMIILYIGPYNRPDFQTDFLLSPILAPEQLLMRFPKVYLLTGERDPLVDDTVVFAGRLRLAHEQRFKERQELGLVSSSAEFDESQHVEYRLIPGISHGFLQFVSVFPEGWNYIFQCDRWIRDAFQAADEREFGPARTPAVPSLPSAGSLANPSVSSNTGGDYFSFTKPVSKSTRHHYRTKSGEDRPLEIGASLHMNTSFSSSSARRIQPGPGAIRKPHPHSGSAMGRRSPISTRRSLVRLASTEDLMGRRMGGLTANMLGGNQEAVQTP